MNYNDLGPWFPPTHPQDSGHWAPIFVDEAHHVDPNLMDEIRLILLVKLLVAPDCKLSIRGLGLEDLAILVHVGI